MEKFNDCKLTIFSCLQGSCWFLVDGLWALKTYSSNDSRFHSPDCSGKPTMKKGSFSWSKRATAESSFLALEKQLFE